MGRSLIDALDITVPEGVVDHIDDAGGRRIWERCELRALTGDGEVAAKAGVRRGCVTMVGGKTFKWNQLIGTEGRTTGMSGALATKDSTGLFTFSGTATASAFTWLVQKTNAISGHWYFTGTDADIYVSNGTTSGRNFYVRQITSTTAYVGIYTTQGREYNTSGRFWFCDMTDTFGAGNEPTTVDAAIAAYKLLGIDITQPMEYDAGSIRSAVPESVVTDGVNKLDPEYITNPTNYAQVKNVNNESIYAVTLHLKPNTRYRFIYFGTVSTSKWISISGPSQQRLAVNATTKSRDITTDDTGILYFGILYTNRAGFAETIVPLFLENGIMINEFSLPSNYVPYRAPITRPIPDAVKAMPGYGWSLGTAVNHIYREGNNWWYKQEVGEADFGALTYTRVTSGTNPYYRFEVAGRKTATDVMQSVYDGVRFASLSVFSGNPSGTLGASTSNQYLAIRDDNYDTANALKAALSGKKCYYELDAPVITDITDMMTGFGWEYMVEGDRYEIVEPSGIQVPMEAAYFVRYGTAAWVSTPSLMLDMDDEMLQMEMTGGAPENFEEV